MPKLRWQFRLRTILILVAVAALLTSGGLWAAKMRQRYLMNRQRAPHYIAMAKAMDLEIAQRANWLQFQLWSPTRSSEDHRIREIRNMNQRVSLLVQKKREYEYAATHPLAPPLEDAVLPSISYAIEAATHPAAEFPPITSVCKILKVIPELHQEAASRITDLHVLDSDVTDEALSNLRVLSNLQTLGLSGRNFTDAGLVHVASLRNLSMLFLCSPQVTDASLPHLWGLQNLVDLNLSGSRITSAGIERLRPLSRLQSLVLVSTGVDERGLRSLQGIPGLRKLYIGRGPGFDEGCLAAVGQLDRLQTLGLVEMQLTDRGIAELKRLGQLKSLYLDGCSCAGALKPLGELTSLKVLRLENCDIGDRDLEAVRNLRGLTELSLSGTNVTDAGIRALQGLTALRKLDLSETPVGDACLVHLKSLSNLEKLDLVGTMITVRGAQDLAAQIPGLETDFPGSAFDSGLPLLPPEPAPPPPGIPEAAPPAGPASGR